MSRSSLYAFRANGRATDRTVAKLTKVVQDYSISRTQSKKRQTGQISDNDVAVFLRVMEHLLERMRRDASDAVAPTGTTI